MFVNKPELDILKRRTLKQSLVMRTKRKERFLKNGLCVKMFWEVSFLFEAIIVFAK